MRKSRSPSLRLAALHVSGAVLQCLCASRPRGGWLLLRAGGAGACLVASLLPSAGLGVPKAGSRGGGVCGGGGGGSTTAPLAEGALMAAAWG